MSAKVYILLPVHNRRSITEKFIDCLAAQSYSNYHLVLIDDGSSDDTEVMVREKIGKLTVIKGTGNWWWAGSLQKGIEWLEDQGASDRDIVVFANDDITFDKDFLEKAVKLLEGMDSVFLLPHVYDEKSGKPLESGIEADFKKFTFNPATSQEKINCLSTRGLFMRMSDLRKVGGFYPKLLPHYLSDYEYTIRAKTRGITLCTDSSIAICMDHSTSGIRSFEQVNFVTFLRQLFSKRAVDNPIYMSTFIITASPIKYMPLNLVKVWRNAAIIIIRQFGYALKQSWRKTT